MIEPSSTNNFSQHQLLVIGCGGAGCNALNFFRTSHVFSHDIETLAIDEISTKNNFKIKMPQTKKIRNAVIICGLGGKTGGELAPEIINTLKKLNITCKAIVILPFFFEGFKRNKIAQKQLNLINKACHTLYTISNEDSSQKLSKKNPNMKFISFLETINKKIMVEIIKKESPNE